MYDDRILLYSAWDHWLIDGHEPQIFATGDFSMEFEADSQGLLVNVCNDTGVATPAGTHMEFYDVEINVYYYELTPEQKQIYFDWKKVQGLTFAFWDFTTDKCLIDNSTI